MVAARPGGGVPGDGVTVYRRGRSETGPRRGRPPRNSKWLSFSIAVMEAAWPSQGIRANWRADSQAALYQILGLSPG
jgi:hypothetical protein